MVMFRSVFSIISVVMILGMCQVSVAQHQNSSEKSRPAAVKLLEIGQATDRSASAQFSELLDSLDRNKWNSWSPEFHMLIFLYGTEREIARRKRIIMKVFGDTRWYHVRITLVEGGACKAVSTIVWQVPHDAKMPDVCDEQSH